MLPLKQKLYDRPTAFDFYQAVFLLETDLANLHESRPDIRKLIRFKTHQALSFPSSSLRQLLPTWNGKANPTIFVNFLGLTGVQGALPLNYSMRILEQIDVARKARKINQEGFPVPAIQEWFDLFNHQMIAFLYQAWEKYRFPVSYFHVARRKEAGFIGSRPQEQQDPFTSCMLSLIGLGIPSLRNRFHVKVDNKQLDDDDTTTTLASINDLALLRHSSLLANRPRSMPGLVALLTQYFGLRFEIRPFSGQWLKLEPASQAQLVEPSQCQLGVNVVAGERIWDLNSIFRVRIGPLHYRDFVELLPDITPVAARKSFFLVSQLIRFFVGPEFDFELQLLLFGEEVPECVLQEVPEGTLGARLGWNTWLTAEKMPYQVEETIFFGDERTMVEPTIRL